MCKRIEKWDNLKFLLIFLVVLGHICDQYVKRAPAVRALFLFIYSFHMPLFFFISGLFSKRKIREKDYSSIFSYFMLYLVSQAVLLFGKILIFGEGELELFDTKDAPWFTFVLFMCYLVTVFLQRFNEKYILLVTVLLACIAGYDNSVSDILQISRFLVFYPFFYAGFVMEADKVQHSLSGKRIRIISMFGLILFAFIIFKNISGIYWIRALETGRNPFSQLKDGLAVYGGLFRLAFYMCSTLIGAMVIAIIPEQLGGGWIAHIGSRSMQIYVLHRVFIMLLCNKWQIDRLLKIIWPSHYFVLLIPLAGIITLICSWKGLEKPLRRLIIPPQKM